jgi:hypothetical protein
MRNVSVLIATLIVGGAGAVVAAELAVGLSGSAVPQAHIDDDQLNRTLKGDRLPHVAPAEPPREVSSIEVGPGRVVLRDAEGRAAFVVDAKGKLTVASKGYSFPALAMEMPAVRSRRLALGFLGL